METMPFEPLAAPGHARLRRRPPRRSSRTLSLPGGAARAWQRVPIRPAAAAPLVAAANDPLSERLLDLLARTTDWLKFAETKNVGIVGLASGGIAALIAAAGFVGEIGLQGLAGLGLLGGGVLLAAALLIGVWSFLPATSVPRWMRRRAGTERPDDNLFYFGHLAVYTPEDLTQAIADRYLDHSPPKGRIMHRDLAAQIIVNARITLQKLTLFRWAALCFAGGVLLSAAGMLLAIVA